MKLTKNFYLIWIILGTIIPWVFFYDFFNSEGLNIFLFVKSLFINGAVGGFSSDIIISLLVFWIWSFNDSKKNNVKNWWLIFLAGFFVGLSLAMPLYFYLKEIEIES